MSLVVKRYNNKPFLYASLIRYKCNKRENATNGDYIKSIIPDIKVPQAHFVEFVMKDFGKWPNKIATECAVTQKKYTFEEIRQNAINLGKSLRKVLRLKKGDVVGIFLPNNPDYPICVFGIILSALTVTTINPSYTVDELERHLKDAGVKVLFTNCSHWNIAQQATNRLKERIPVVVVRTKVDELLPDGAINYDDLLHMKVDLPDVVPIEDEDVIFLPYSSGTTGLPKGVMLTNRNLVANLAQHLTPNVQYAIEANKDHQDVLPLILPMYHIYGFTVSTMSLLQIGCKLVTIPKFSPDTFIEIMARHKPTILHLVPPLVMFLNSHAGVQQKYLERLRVTLCGAAPLGASDEDKFRATVGRPTQIIQAYGMTETSPLAFIIPQTHEGKHFGTFGHPVANTLVKVVNPNDSALKHLGSNQPGEILIKGPQVMKGYFKKPSETKSAFADGWYRTGDIAKYDENYMFYIIDRIKELIKVKGFQVAPAELEEVIRCFPGVLEAAVIGVPHTYLGESPRAYIVEKPGEKVNVQKLIGFVQSKVAKHKNLVGGVAIIDSIPKNPSGKILRKQLRSLYDECSI
ncbi:hypothetical protein Trydic_g16485 [Trypoxylus dichotomus]